MSQRQLEALRLVKEAIARLGYPPSVREIAAGMGITPKAALEHLRGLQRKGLIRRTARRPRAIELVGSEPALAWNARPVPLVATLPKTPRNSLNLPAILDQHSIGRITLDSKLFPGDLIYCLQVGPAEFAVFRASLKATAGKSNVFVEDSGQLSVVVSTSLAAVPRNWFVIGPVVGRISSE